MRVTVFKYYAFKQLKFNRTLKAILRQKVEAVWPKYCSRSESVNSVNYNTKYTDTTHRSQDVFDIATASHRCSCKMTYTRC